MTPLVVYADGPDAPLPDPAALDTLRRLDGADFLLGWVLREPGWLDALPRRATALMAGYGLSRALARGAVRAVPTRLSTVPSLLASRLRPAVAVVAGRPDGQGFRFTSGVGWAHAAASHAGAVVVEVSRDAPVIDSPWIPGRVVEVVERDAPPDPPPEPRAGPVEERIAALAAAFIPEGATVQWGPGVIPGAVLRAVDRPVRVLSGLVTDDLADLAERSLLQGAAETTYMWGGGRLRALAAAGGVKLRPLGDTHNPSRLASIERFVAVNTALEVGLDGAVNVERAGGRVVAGPGGHADYCEAASRSEGGLSIIALRSTHRDRSSIVLRPEVVTTPRTDVGIVVTEHGTADLRDADEDTRAQRLIAIAAPEHRDRLAAQWQSSGGSPL